MSERDDWMEIAAAGQRQVRGLNAEVARLTAEVARLSAIVPSGGDQPLRCQVNNGAIVVCFGERILAAATECLSNLYDFENDRPLYRVTDPALFAKSVAAAMHDEGEDGSTPLENTYMSRRGGRHCRACARIRAKRAQLQKGTP